MAATLASIEIPETINKHGRLFEFLPFHPTNSTIESH